MAAPVRSIKNQYLGINAHLNSKFQSIGGWNSFHTRHIGDLTGLMRVELRSMGYIADIEQSLQIRQVDEAPRFPKADVTIYDPDLVRAGPTALQGGTYEVVLPVVAMLELTETEIKHYRAIGLYELVGKNRDERGDPVAWIELLSPSNKPGGQDYEDYRHKRLKVLQSGLVFVEIDYLHESPPTIAGVTNYRPKDKSLPAEPGSHPYRIAVSDPRPDFWDGMAHIHQFDVDDPIPTVSIPLNAGDVLEFDFNRAYQKTFEEMVYGELEVDYSKFPENFGLYSESDQLRIAARMLAVLEAARRGENLEQAPTVAKIDGLTLETALNQLKVS